MRRPDDDPGAGELSEAARWISVPAAKYLKHRAIGWHEAESPDELPADWRALADERESFPVEAPSEKGAE